MGLYGYVPHRPMEAALNEKIIIVANIERYRALLQKELDDDRRSMIRKLLAEEETKLARLPQASSSSGESRRYLAGIKR